MPNRTANLNLNTFLENEVVNFEHINENFEILDSQVMCIESGTQTSSYTGGVTGLATWYYKKWSDSTVDMSCKLEFANLKCNGGSEAPYYSGTSRLYLPFEMSAVYDVQLHLASNTIGWVSNITNRSVIDSVYFRVMGMWLETEFVYKQVFVQVKGVLA